MTPRSWWRRNLVALIAVIILLPAIAALTWTLRVPFVEPEVAPTTYPVDERVERDNAVLRVIATTDVTDTAFDPVPADARMIEVILAVQTTQEQFECGIDSLTEVGGAGRSWVLTNDGAPNTLGIDMNDYCTDGPHLDDVQGVSAYFIVPDDIANDTMLDVQIGSVVDGSSVRFRLPSLDDIPTAEDVAAGGQ